MKVKDLITALEAYKRPEAEVYLDGYGFIVSIRCDEKDAITIYGNDEH